ncbi:MAG: nucleotidyltransferase family protein [Pyrinomonadaceae bacterium]
MAQTFSNSRLIAKALAGSWRPFPSPLEISVEELDAATPLLLESGVAALVWRRLCLSNLKSSRSAFQLQQASRLHTLQSAVHARNIREVFTLLRSAGIQPILVKGWAIARLYPDEGLRPYGDIDLCVSPKQYLQSKVVLDSEMGKRYLVDLHQGFVKLDDQSWPELYSRSRRFRLKDVEVRIPGSEDHLRILCFHFLREGAWRPLWLCDIALALETRPANFDWDLFLGKDPRRRAWFACTIALAHRLLEVSLDGIPAAALPQKLPSWFIRSVLCEWEVHSMYERHRTPMATAWRNPVRAMKKLRYRWPNAIEGTVSMNGPFNDLPRLPFQLGNCLSRTMEFLWRSAQTPTQPPGF